ncbi:MAG: response regulator [Acidimicrobiia bacterium]|nr:response regulator [Acidimicrobiia bacterium]
MDDEPRVLKGLRRRLGREYDITIAESGAEALATMRQTDDYQVIVSDMRMPAMNGVQLLATARKEFPDTVRVLLTGQADLNDAIAAVNEGSIFRFLTKPCPPEVLAPALEAAVAHNRLVSAERELLEGTVSGSVALLAEILAIRDPAAAARGVRLKSHVAGMAKVMELPMSWDIEVAATLSEIGYALLPSEIVDRWRDGFDLSESEQKVIDGQGQLARDLVANIPRLESVSAILAQLAPDAGAATDDRVQLGADLIEAAGIYEGMLKSGLTEGAAVAQLRNTRPDIDAEIVKALEQIAVAAGGYVTMSLGVDDLVSGVMLAADLYTADGRLLLTEGSELTPAARSRILQYADHVGVREPIAVRVPA